MTLADLEAATQSSQDWDKLTKAKLKELRFQGETVTERTMTRDAQTGDNGMLTEVRRDALTNAVVSRRVTRWTYFSSGEIEDIEVVELDESDIEESHYHIRHFLDRKQPERIVERQCVNMVR